MLRRRRLSLTSISSGVLISVVLLLGPTGANAQTAIDPKYLLVPGKSMGFVQLGMSLAELKALLGEPSYTSTPRAGHDYDRWYYFGDPSPTASKMSGIGVFLRQGKVVSARTFEAAYRTAEGAGVGSALPELIAVYGTPQKQTTHSFDFNKVVHIDELYVEWGSIGISAHIDRSTGRVAFVDIDTPK